MTASPWGKLEHDAQGHIVFRLSLAEHSGDVAGVFRALIDLPGIRARLARLAGVADLADVWIERLTLLVFLHDMGKVNRGFQARSDTSAPPIGHIGPLRALLGSRPVHRLNQRVAEIMQAERLGGWGEAMPELLDVVLSHHGAPWDRDRDGLQDEQHWRAAGAYDPMQALADLWEQAVNAAPASMATSGPPLPMAPAFHHALAGLIQLADWIGSAGWKRLRDGRTAQHWASEQLQAIGMNPEPWRMALLDRTLSFEELFGYPPHPHQRACSEMPGEVVILEAETGSGKTEAALWRFINRFKEGRVDGLYFALPTRTAAVQLHQRVVRFAQAVWGEKAPEVVLAVPGYLDDTREAGGLPAAPDLLDLPEGDARLPARWASEHPKRFFTAMMGVGTVDQVLLAGLRTRHAHLRGAALMRHLMVVDEVHASDHYMQQVLQQLLADHVQAGGESLLLSATLGREQAYRLLQAAKGLRPEPRGGERLDAAQGFPYPLLSGGGSHTTTREIVSTAAPKRVHMAWSPLLDDPAGIARVATEAARLGAKVLVIRNTVAGAIAVQRMLEQILPLDSAQLFRVNGHPTVHHGRFAREDRRRLDTMVEQRLGKRRADGGLIVVGTQTLEQSLDIDADYLLTDLCPMDVLLQRIGRLHRHPRADGGGQGARPAAYQHPQCLVIGPKDGLDAYLPSRGGPKDRHGLGFREVDGRLVGVYQDVSILQLTASIVQEQSVWSIPSDNRSLVERSTHSDAIQRMIRDLDLERRRHWEEHRGRVTGDLIARAQLARHGALCRNVPFMEQPVDSDARVTTRLGADGLLVRLPATTLGAFGQVISQISIPAWMVAGSSDAAQVDSVRVTQAASGTVIAVGDRAFQYGPHGLERMPRGNDAVS